MTLCSAVSALQACAGSGQRGPRPAGKELARRGGSQFARLSRSINRQIRAPLALASAGAPARKGPGERVEKTGPASASTGGRRVRSMAWPASAAARLPPRPSALAARQGQQQAWPAPTSRQGKLDQGLAPGQVFPQTVCRHAQGEQTGSPARTQPQAGIPGPPGPACPPPPLPPTAPDGVPAPASARRHPGSGLGGTARNTSRSSKRRRPAPAKRPPSLRGSYGDSPDRPAWVQLPNLHRALFPARPGG